MTVVKMPLVNVRPQVSADVCKGDGSDADGEGKLGGGQNGTFWGHSLWMNP